MPRSVDRACKILELLGSTKGGLKLTEISKALDVPVSSLSSILSSLVENGYLLVHPETKRYILGPKNLILASYYLSSFDVVHLGQPIIIEVMMKTGESAALVVRKDAEIIVVYGENCSQAIRWSVEIGHRTPIYASAGGKAILAFQRDSETEEYLASVSLIPLTTATISDIAELRKELIATRASALAYNREEEYEGMSAIAAPVLDLHGCSIAAIVVNIPSFRLVNKKKELIEQILKEKARELSMKFGYR